MSDPSSDTKKTNTPGWGELLEDAVGINLLALTTLWASIVAPEKLFAATHTFDWEDRKYSPTLRVWLILIAILMFLQFLWANPDSASGQQLKSAFEAYGDPRLTTRESIELALQQYVFVYPLVLMLLCTFAGLLVRIWGSGTPSVVRIRLYFAAILPGSLVTLLTSASSLYITADLFVIYVGVASVAVFFADFFTTHRGLAGVHSVGSRAWRAALLATVNLIVYITSSTIAASIMILWLTKGFELAPILG